jgi:transcriptional regulator with XRE-family HTH domain
MQSLRNLRKAKGLTQEDICERLNVTQASVSHWENGQNRPHSKYLAPLAALLGVTVEELEYSFPGHPPSWTY